MSGLLQIVLIVLVLAVAMVLVSGKNILPSGLSNGLSNGFANRLTMNATPRTYGGSYADDEGNEDDDPVLRKGGRINVVSRF